jgi:hypothetical protein
MLTNSKTRKKGVVENPQPTENTQNPQNTEGVVSESTNHTEPQTTPQTTYEVLKGEFARQQIYADCGLCDEDFCIVLTVENPDGTTRKTTHHIFSEDSEGNLMMTPYTLNRQLWTTDVEAKNTMRQKTYHIKRLRETVEGKKYDFPRKTDFNDSMPLIPPRLVERFECKETIKTLILTEGYKKALVASVHSELSIIGLPSITLISEKEAERENALYSCIPEIIKTCQVENVVILWDADAPFATKSSIQDETEATNRPLMFARQALKIKEKLKDYNVSVYFAYGKNPQYKGIDDLIMSKPDNEVRLAIGADLTTFDGDPTYFYRTNLIKESDVIQSLRCWDAASFYEMNKNLIGEKRFLFRKKLYSFNGFKVVKEGQYEEKLYNFYEYTEKVNRKGIVYETKITIKPQRLLACLNRLGFWRMDMNGTTQFVEIINNVVDVVEPKSIIDAMTIHLQKLPDELNDGLLKEDLIDKIYMAQSTYFSEQMLYRLPILRIEEASKINFNNDTQEKCFFYYKNAFIEVSKENITMKDYKELKGLIWKEQILPRAIKMEADETPVVFGNFVKLIANDLEKSPDKNRTLHLMQIIGYSMHRFFDSKLKAIIFTDSRGDEDNPSGRSGKTLLCKAIGRMLNRNELDRCFAEIQGKDFDNTDKFKWQFLSPTTSLVHLNDVRKNFQVEDRFGDITEGFSPQKKNAEPFKLWAKLIISSNRTIKVLGPSSLDRIVEFEMSSYFSNEWSPENEFGHWFFRDWDKEEWNRFDNFMFLCSKIYLKRGLPKPVSINLESRKLKEETAEAFLVFMSENVAESGNWYKKEMWTKFKNENTDFEKMTSQKFSQWLKRWRELNTDWTFTEERDRKKADDNLSFQPKNNSISPLK